MKGQKLTKFRPPDNYARNEDIIMTWKLSVNAIYNVFQCRFFYLGYVNMVRTISDHMLTFC